MVSLIDEASKCNDCLGWLHHCHSECCKSFTILNAKGFMKPVKGKKLIVSIRVKSKDLKYYFLHGCSSSHGLLIINVKDFVWDNKDLVILNRCEWLNNKGLCSHYVDRPELCSRLNIDSCGDKEINITPNCLYKYKFK